MSETDLDFLFTDEDEEDVVEEQKASKLVTVLDLLEQFEAAFGIMGESIALEYDPALKSKLFDVRDLIVAMINRMERLEYGESITASQTAKQTATATNRAASLTDGEIVKQLSEDIRKQIDNKILKDIDAKYYRSYKQTADNIRYDKYGHTYYELRRLLDGKKP